MDNGIKAGISPRSGQDAGLRALRARGPKAAQQSSKEPPEPCPAPRGGTQFPGFLELASQREGGARGRARIMLAPAGRISREQHS